MDVSLVFTLSGMIIILGFLANYLFRKTKIPDILILLLLGLLLGPTFHVVDPTSLISIAPLFANLALVILLFNGGLNLDLYKVFQQTPRAGLLAVTGILFSISLVTLIMKLLLGWPLLDSLLLGAMIAGSSSSIVFPLIKELKLNDNVSTMLGLESTFTDAACIVLGITFIQLITLQFEGTITSTMGEVASAFSVGAILGLLMGLVWLKVLRFLKKEEYEDILTIAVALLLYVASENLNGNGSIAALMFGLILGNSSRVKKIFKMRGARAVGKMMKRFHSEISFLVRTFFFVYLGMIVSVTNLSYMLYGLLLSLSLLAGRIAAVGISVIGNPVLEKNKIRIALMMPRGLAAAILSQLPLIYGIENSEVYPEIVFTVIISTVIISAVAAFLCGTKKK